LKNENGACFSIQQTIQKINAIILDGIKSHHRIIKK
jgi:hypothetical protein